MYYLIIPVLICMVIAYALACLWEKPLSYTMPSAVIGIELILLILYLMGMVQGGVWVIIALAILSFAYIIHCFRLKKLSKIDFPIALFLIGIIAVSVYCYGNIVREWDSLRLWGGYPKALYYTNKVQLNDTAWIGAHERTYIPGMPLLVNFFESFFPDFREDVIYIVYAFFHMSLFLPALGRVKQKALMPLGLAAMLLAPLVFYNSYNAYYYEWLYIDPILGMALGYMLYVMSMWDCEDLKSTCSLLIAMCGVIMLKDIGIFFVAIVLLGCLVKLMRKRMLLKKQNMVYALPIFLYLFWGVAMSIYGTANQVTKFHVGDFFQDEGFRKFLRYIFHEALIDTLHPKVSPYCTAVNILLFFTVCAAGLWLIMKQAGEKGNYGNAFGCMAVIQLGYLVCLYISTVSLDKAYISTYRYENALLLGFFVFIMLVFLGNSHTVIPYILKKKVWLGLIVAACLCIVAMFPPKKPLALESSAYLSAEIAANKIRKLLPGNSDAPVRVCVLLDGAEEDKSLMIQRIYFNLIGEVYAREGIVLVDETRSQEEGVEMLLQMVEEYSCDYIFTLDNSEVLSRYGGLFQDRPKNYELYQFNRDIEKLVLAGY